MFIQIKIILAKMVSVSIVKKGSKESQTQNACKRKYKRVSQTDPHTISPQLGHGATEHLGSQYPINTVTITVHMNNLSV